MVGQLRLRLRACLQIKTKAEVAVEKLREECANSRERAGEREKVRGER